MNPPISHDLVDEYQRFLQASPDRSLADYLSDKTWIHSADLAELVIFDQMTRWSTHGTAPSAEAYLRAFGERLGADSIQCDVIYGEMRARHQSGRKVDPDDYYRRFPAHSSLLRKQVEVADWLDHEADYGLTTSRGAAAVTVPMTASIDAPLAPLSGLDFEILRSLGSGGMGTVVLARQKSLGKLVALKFLNNTAQLTESGLERFLLEARSVARLRHPGIVQVHGIGQSERGYFLLMDYVDGQSLAERLREGRLSVVESIRLTIEAARAISHAHAHDIIHRDLKPGNILIDREGHAFVTDFGIAKCLTQDDIPLTKPGQILGTPQFMAPEQLDPNLGSISQRTDVYGIGGVLFSMLTGRPPVEGETLPVVVKNLLHSSGPPSPAKYRDDVPRELELLLQNCLAIRPQDRPESVVDVISVLESVPSEPATMRLSSLALARRPRRAALIALGGLALAGFFWKVRASRLESTDSAPLVVESTWQVSVYRGGLLGRRETFSQSSAPLANGDQLRVEIRLSRPAYAAVIWVGPDGQMKPLTVSSAAVSALTVPADERDALPITGLAGTEVCLLVLKSTAWTAGEVERLSRTAKGPPAMGEDIALCDGVPVRDVGEVGEQMLSQLNSEPRTVGAPERLSASPFDRQLQNWLKPLELPGDDVHYFTCAHAASEN